MGKIYDNWGKLLEAVMDRELLRKLSLQSESSSTVSSDSDYSSSVSSYRYDDTFFTPSPAPLQPDELRIKLEQIRKAGRPDLSDKVPTRRTNLWKGISIFNGLLSSKKKENGKEERKLKWVNGHRAFLGHEPVKSYSLGNSFQVAEEAKRTELERLQELHTFKGHIEAIVRAKGLDGDSFNHYYTV